MSDDDMTPDAGDGAPFDMSTLTPSDVPYIGPAEPDEPPAPDHAASAAMGEDDTDTTSPRVGRRKRGKMGRAKEPRADVPKVRAGSLVRPLTEMYTSVGMMLAPFDPACSLVIIENAKPCAESLDALARENEAVRRAILALTQTSAWGGVLIAHLPMLLVIMAHHGPREVAERVAPLAGMMAPNAAAAAQAAAAQRDGDSAA